MKTIAQYIIIIILIFLIGAGSGGFIVYKYYNKPVPVPNDPIPGPVASKPVDRPKDLECEKAKDLLWHYDNDAFQIDWKTLSQTRKEVKVNITGNLFQRNFEQSATIPLIEQDSGNWKLYLGIGIGTVATISAIYGGYKLYKVMK